MEFHDIVPHDGDIDGEGEGNVDAPATPDPTCLVRGFKYSLFEYLLYIVRPHNTEYECHT